MAQRRQRMILAAAVMVLISSGCQAKATGGSAQMYYSAIEDGDYYEGWAAQLQEQAAAQGASFDVGYAQNSVETQDAQIKSAVGSGCDVFLCGPVSPETVTRN